MSGVSQFIFYLAVLLFLFTPFLWLFFLIRQQHFNDLIKGDWSRKKITAAFLGILLLLFAVMGVTVPSTETTNQQTNDLAQEESVSPATATPAAEKSSDSVGSVVGKASGRSQATVASVIDGDTIRLEDGSRLRYIGIDSPETRDPSRPVECYGPEAHQKNKELVEGKTVELEKDVSETDRYDRLLRYVYVDGQMVNEILVRGGFAIATAYPPDVKHQYVFDAAEADARQAERGLWGNDVCTTPTPIPILSPTPGSNTNQTNESWTCNCNKYCGQMSSCEEAYYQLNQCGCSDRDGDNDGVPCEKLCV